MAACTPSSSSSSSSGAEGDLCSAEGGPHLTWQIGNAHGPQPPTNRNTYPCHQLSHVEIFHGLGTLRFVPGGDLRALPHSYLTQRIYQLVLESHPPQKIINISSTLTYQILCWRFCLGVDFLKLIDKFGLAGHFHAKMDRFLARNRGTNVRLPRFKDTELSQAELATGVPRS